jgi:hypothetical protein
VTQVAELVARMCALLGAAWAWASASQRDAGCEHGESGQSQTQQMGLSCAQRKLPGRFRQVIQSRALNDLMSSVEAVSNRHHFSHNRKAIVR